VRQGGQKHSNNFGHRRSKPAGIISIVKTGQIPCAVLEKVGPVGGDDAGELVDEGDVDGGRGRDAKGLRRPPRRGPLWHAD